MSGGFAAFIGIDWSGAETANGIAVARCRPGRSAPKLVRPAGTRRRWRRLDVLSWLTRLAMESEGLLLVGFDFAFSVGSHPDLGFIVGDGASAFDLWQRVEDLGSDGDDYYAGSFVAHPDYRDWFRRRNQPVSRLYRANQRTTERACSAARLGDPQSPFNLIGAKQVGMGALAGMRVLYALRQALAGEVAIWPFDDDWRESRLVCVEIYPRLFIRRTGGGNRKLESWEALNACLVQLDSKPVLAGLETPSDHDTDALISAAGLRCLAGSRTVWSPAGLDTRARRQEGWIFGVGA
ncbi:MAG: hypothetical protein HYR63_06575 [Proteobacteria bacterium]|nr:hypothetical protein [Pseudomonadota bacterium]